MRPTPDRFARVLKTRDVLILAFGAMIGWSWVLMTGYWVGNAGSLGTLAGAGLLCLYMPFSPSALAWPQEWGMVLGWGGLGALVWFTRRKN